MSVLCLTTPETDLVQLGANAWPRFDKIERVDGPQALDRLRACSGAADTTWLLQWDAQGPSPSDLRQALRGVKQHVRVLVLLPIAAGHSEAVAWLDAGADRCLSWPCPPELLAAMLRALLRPIAPWASRISQFGDLRFDHEAMTLNCNEQRIALTQREAEVMSLLMRRAGKMVTNHDILLHMAKGQPCVLRPATVQLYVHRVNRKIEPSGVHVGCVKRVGYGLMVKPEAAAAELDAVWALPAVSAHRPFSNQSFLGNTARV
jgi:two-component system OmpR family response regulator